MIIFGGLHIEMALWNVIGDFLEDAGWTVALTDAGIASSGTADSFLKATHLTRTRHAHQVMMLALAKLQREAWQAFASSNSEDISFEIWRQNMRARSPTFLYWDLIFEFEMMTLIFIRAHRINDFNHWRTSCHGFLYWIIPIMLGGYPFILRICNLFLIVLPMNLGNVGYFKRPNTYSLVCLLIKVMNRIMSW